MENQRILFVDGCVRTQSNTRILAERVLSHLSGEVTRIRLDPDGPPPLTRAPLERRMALQEEEQFEDPMFAWAREFARADIIVMASPYWDLSFCAGLKAFIEQICVVGLTFIYDEQEQPQTLCRAKQLIYVTTAGGEILSDEFGYGYIKAVAQTFFHIPEVLQFKAQRLDLLGEDPKRIMEEALQEIDAYYAKGNAD